jgi:hypothetical protein
VSDQFYDLTTALLSFEQDEKRPDVPFMDRSASSGGWIFTNSTGIPPLATAWKKFGDYSLGHFHPSDTIYREDSSVVAIGSQDFCIEGWVNLDTNQPSTTPALFISFNAPEYDWLPNAFGIFCDREDDGSSGKLSFHAYNSPTNRLLESTSVVAGAGETHIAVTRDGSTWRLFVDGQLESTATWGGTLNNPSVVYAACIGSDTRVGVPRWYVKGYIDEVRITIGVPRYVANFTPQATPFYFAPIIARAIATGPVRQVPPGTFPAAPVARAVGAVGVRRDVYFAGDGVILGTVKEQGSPSNVPLRRKVLLLDETTNLIVREVWSDAVTGAYSFANIDRSRRYTVITYDYLRNYRAVIADNLVASVAA